MTPLPVLPSPCGTGKAMAGKSSRISPKRSRRRINWSRLLFMFLGLLVVLAFILSMITTG
jgi:hypothetical protein